MVLAGEIVRCGRGRYVVPGRQRAEPAIETTPASVEPNVAVPVHTRAPRAAPRERADALAEAMLVCPRVHRCRQSGTLCDVAADRGRPQFLRKYCLRC